MHFQTEWKCFKCGTSSTGSDAKLSFFTLNKKIGQRTAEVKYCLGCRGLVKVCVDCRTILEDDSEMIIINEKEIKEKDGKCAKEYQCEQCYITAAAEQSRSNRRGARVAMEAYEGL